MVAVIKTFGVNLINNLLLPPLFLHNTALLSHGWMMFLLTNSL